MTKAWAVGFAVLSGLCFGLNAQQNDGMNAFNATNRSLAPVASLGLSDASRFPFGSAFAWMEPADNFLPGWKPDGWDAAPDYKVATTSRQRRQRTGNDYKNVSDAKDTTGGSVELRKSLFDNIHGEVGFLYGASSGGRVSHQVESSYIFGTAGDEHVQISVGAFYEHSNTDFSRRSR
jgi:hypothetical protein